MFSGWGKKVGFRERERERDSNMGMLVPYYDFLFVCLIYLFIYWGESYEKTWQPVNLFQFRFSLFVVSLRPQLFEKQLVTEMFQDGSEIKSRRLQITSQHRERERDSKWIVTSHLCKKTKQNWTSHKAVTSPYLMYNIASPLTNMTDTY